MKVIAHKKKLTIAVSSMALLSVLLFVVQYTENDSISTKLNGSVAHDIKNAENSDVQKETETEQPENNQAEQIASSENSPGLTPIEPQSHEQKPAWPVVYTEEEANSLSIVVNKKHRLPSTYVPQLVEQSGALMRKEAADALSKLLLAAGAAGKEMVVVSSYRSYTTQQSTYQKWVNVYGQSEADRISARPGHSEHQTGLAVDVDSTSGTCRLSTCFGATPTGVWLSENALYYGYIIRYPDGKEVLTGYSYEPWHLRYVGVSVASDLFESGRTLDEYYGVPAGDYN